MATSFDGKLGYRSWDVQPDLSYLGPFESYQDARTEQALASVQMSAEDIRRNVVVPLRQVRVFRSRRGYPPVQSRQATVVDIVEQSRPDDDRSTWYSGGPSGMSGASRYSTNGLGLA